ncbi:MAG: hypothetical protein J0I12_11130 [Candidatus Eremiobacteraeota bacterium]|mgnify:CR=1 FL=1|nr:hypothetical protein [Candidatus Eremiobacteraeota bacterium]
MPKRSGIAKSDITKIKREMTRRCNAVVKAVRLWWFYDFCLSILDAAVKNAPMKSGKLRRSAYMGVNGKTIGARGNNQGAKATGTDLGRSSQQARATLGFGGELGAGDVQYAGKVHERTDLKHKSGMAKYLEVAVAAHLDLVQPGLARVVAEALNGAS